MAPVKRKEKPEEVAAKVATKAARELVRGISGIVPVIPLAALEKANHEVRRASRDIRKHAKDLNGSMLSGSIVDEGVVKRAFTPEEHKRYGPEIGEINRLVSEIGRARKEGDMETADRHAKELRSNIEALATKEHMRKKTVSQLIDQKATELTGSKNIRER